MRTFNSFVRVTSFLMVIGVANFSLNAFAANPVPLSAKPALSATDSKNPAKGGTHSQEEIDDAVAIQNLLATNTFDGVAAAAQKLSADATKNKHAELAKKASALAEAKKIEAARALYIPVSNDISELAKNEKNTTVDINYCPMKEARWVQKPGKVANPFFGKGDMLECGVKEK